MAGWKAKAKAQFSTSLDKAETEGPQLLERRRKRFYVLTEEDLARRDDPPEVSSGSRPSG